MEKYSLWCILPLVFIFGLVVFFMTMGIREDTIRKNPKQLHTITVSDGKVYQAIGPVDVNGEDGPKTIVFHDAKTGERVELLLGSKTAEVRRIRP